MAGLQVLEEKFSAQGFNVAGFYSDDFGNQGGDPGQIDACNDKFKATFDIYQIDHVKGANARPVFAWLIGEPNPGPSATKEPNWNFNKYLISKEGKLVGHWIDEIYPGDDPTNPNDSFDGSAIVKAIKAELAK